MVSTELAALADKHVSKGTHMAAEGPRFEPVASLSMKHLQAIFQQARHDNFDTPFYAIKNCKGNMCNESMGG